MTPFDLPDFDQHESVHFFSDAASGLEAIIALHSTALGPAAGGCRSWRYASRTAALTDVLRLSRGMSYKNALAGLPFGGGKAVILEQPGRPRSSELFEAFGRAVDSLGGAYVTAEDVGTTVADMRVIATRTRYVSGLASSPGVAGGDPSPKTAYGVFLGLREGWRHVSGSEDLWGVRVAVQGLGGVGYHLCQRLHAAGARLFVSDLRTERTERAREEFNAVVVAPEVAPCADVDILAPCALGAILNVETIPQISARLIAGGANNQLATASDGVRLRERGILYAPDYVVNAGGIICAASEYLGRGSEQEVLARITRIRETLNEVFERASAEALPTDVVADRMAQERIAQGRSTSGSTVTPQTGMHRRALP